jgi:hypothetical protein
MTKKYLGLNIQWREEEECWKMIVFRNKEPF